ncbi:hypothetical protein [Microbacterium sp. NPDC087591]|jgi:hypothetical protein|uniref:hypothetical protein n=1 Tax=Microbacterium sp. NPDC087591 TaxID=3364192 RepID=UPI00380CFED7
MTIIIRAGVSHDHARLVAVWRSAVEATHHFLTPEEIDGYERQVEAYLPQMPEIWVAVEDGEGQPHPMLHLEREGGQRENTHVTRGAPQG